MSGVAVFILVTPANSTDAVASKEREREREIDTHRGKERERDRERERERDRKTENATKFNEQVLLTYFLYSETLLI